jgi:hypothetical protein
MVKMKKNQERIIGDFCAYLGHAKAIAVSFAAI